MRPDVSVVIPTYNRRSMVQEAIESCFAGNDEINVEVVVVDDGSTDGTRDYLESLDDERVRPIFQEHQGAQVARNTGQRAARGHTIKHLDDDDYLLPGMLEKEYRLLRDREVDVCYGDFLKRDETTNETWRYENAAHTDFFVALSSKEINRLQLAILFDREAVEDINWNEDLRFLQDFDFMLRVASQGLECVKLDEAVALHRMHQNPRISDVRQQARARHRFSKKCQWYYQAFLNLQKHVEALTPEQRCAAAIGLWQEARKLATRDWEEARSWLQRAHDIYPELRPPRSGVLLSVLDHVGSPLITEAITVPLRRLRLHLT